MTLDEYLAAGYKKYYMPGQQLPEPPDNHLWKPMYLNGVLKMFKLMEIDKKSCGC